MSNEDLVLEFMCTICNVGFVNRRALAGHKAGKHFHATCSSCNQPFDDRSKFGHHLIEAHGYTNKQLGWGLPAGWNRGKLQIEAFNVAPEKVHHGNAEFMKSLNDPDYLKIKYRSRKYHEQIVVKKKQSLGHRVIGRSILRIIRTIIEYPTLSQYRQREKLWPLKWNRSKNTRVALPL
jgi:hypothetical protein